MGRQNGHIDVLPLEGVQEGNEGGDTRGQSAQLARHYHNLPLKQEAVFDVMWLVGWLVRFVCVWRG